MVNCGRCGSDYLVRYRSSPIDKVVRLFTNRKRVICRRCGWTARIAWKHDDSYIPAPVQLAVTDRVPQLSNDASGGEDDFDINRFH